MRKQHVCCRLDAEDEYKSYSFSRNASDIVLLYFDTSLISSLSS